MLSPLHSFTLLQCLKCMLLTVAAICFINFVQLTFNQISVIKIRCPRLYRPPALGSITSTHTDHGCRRQVSQKQHDRNFILRTIGQLPKVIQEGHWSYCVYSLYLQLLVSINRIAFYRFMHLSDIIGQTGSSVFMLVIIKTCLKKLKQMEY